MPKTILKKENLAIEVQKVGTLQTNVYYVINESLKEAIVIDAPKPANEVVSRVLGYKTLMVFITHSHWDHLDGADEVTNALKVRCAIGQGELKNLKINPTKLVGISDQTVFDFKWVKVKALSTPGHTDGSTCYYITPTNTLLDGVLFSGDTLFPGGPGRTTSPKNFESILKSIENKLLSLPKGCIVLPGHGDKTTISTANSEYEQFCKRDKQKKLMGDVTWTV